MLAEVVHLLQNEFDIVAAVGDGVSAVQSVADLKPNVVVLDIEMPLLNGFEVAQQICPVLPRELEENYRSNAGGLDSRPCFHAPFEVRAAPGPQPVALEQSPGDPDHKRRPLP